MRLLILLKDHSGHLKRVRKAHWIQLLFILLSLIKNARLKQGNGSPTVQQGRNESRSLGKNERTQVLFMLIAALLFMTERSVMCLCAVQWNHFQCACSVNSTVFCSSLQGICKLLLCWSSSRAADTQEVYGCSAGVLVLLGG